MITIQKPTAEDIYGVQDVFYETWLKTYPNEEFGITKEDVEERFKDRFSLEKIEKRLAGMLNLGDDQLFLIAKDEEKVIGICKLEKLEEVNNLGAIYVLPEYQGRGVGEKFWEQAREFFGDRRDIIVRVVTYNSGAIGFYKKIGFVDTGKRFTEENYRMPISGKMFPEMELVIEAKNKSTHSTSAVDE